MPWCPKCKMEFEEGITVCSDCKETLVDSLNTDTLCPLIYLKEDLAKKIVDFLKYSEINSAVYYYDEEHELYVVAADKKEEKSADKLIRIFKTNERELFEEDEVDSSITEDVDKKDTLNNSMYANKAEKYEDVKSSAFTFLFVGGLGIIILILQLAGVINIPVSDAMKPVFYTVMGAMFIIFIIIGIQSSIACKKFKPLVSAENELTDEIINFICENYTLDDYKRSIDDPDFDELEQEIQFFKYIEMISLSIKDEFDEKSDELDDNYLEHLSEDIYARLTASE